jgi:TolB-like protein
MNLFAELKRRKVFKVGAAYLVVAWVAIQVVTTLAPQFQLPEWAPRLVTLILLIGFPIALVMAWMFDITPDGVVRDAGDAAAASPPPAAAIAATPAAVIPIVPHKSIAVLPFADLSPTHDQEYFSDGIAEEILNALVKLKDLKVAGRTSSFSFKGRNEDLREIGKALSVAHVLEGSVRKHGDKVRITAQLIQVDDGYHLWSDNYDGDLSDVFELQERIARAITRELDVILHGDAQQRLVPVATRDPDAYALYLQATGIFNRREGSRFPEAIAQLEQALKLDPQYARAHARLAAIHALEPIYTPDTTEASLAAVEREAALAIALDPALAEPHAALAMMHAQQTHLVDAHVAMKHALAIDPDDLTANLWAGVMANSDGYIAKSCMYFDRVLAIDPLLPNALLWRGIEYLNASEIERGETLMRRATDAGLQHAGVGLHMVFAAHGQTEEAIAQLTVGLRALGAGIPPEAPALIAAAVYGDVAARDAVLTLIERTLAAAKDGRMLVIIPYALLLLGEYQRALKLFRRKRTNNSPLFFFLLWSPAARAARLLPEFAVFARENGMVELWDRYGPPDGCHKNAAGDYVFD